MLVLVKHFVKRTNVSFVYTCIYPSRWSKYSDRDFCYFSTNINKNLLIFYFLKAWFLIFKKKINVKLIKTRLDNTRKYECFCNTIRYHLEIPAPPPFFLNQKLFYLFCLFILLVWFVCLFLVVKVVGVLEPVNLRILQKYTFDTGIICFKFIIFMYT